MKSRIKNWAGALHSDYALKIFASSAMSGALGSTFALFNGVLWMMHRSVWNGTICIYYILLTAVRAVLMRYYKKDKAILTDKTSDARVQKRMYIYSHLLIFLMNISMVTPIAIMVREEREVGFGMIPAIAVATYTTYRITFAIVNYRRSSRSRNGIIKTLTVINLIDALMAVLTLQNTLITVNRAKSNGDMITLSAVSSAAILAVIILISAFSLRNSFKSINDSGV